MSLHHSPPVFLQSQEKVLQHTGKVRLLLSLRSGRLLSGKLGRKICLNLRMSLGFTHSLRHVILNRLSNDRSLGCLRCSSCGSCLIRGCAVCRGGIVGVGGCRLLCLRRLFR